MEKNEDKPSRTRFAKREIVRALEALERAADCDLDPWMGMIALEERLEDARQDAAEWRTKYEALKLLLATPSPTAANGPSGSSSESAST